jgi:hypothetical protein
VQNELYVCGYTGFGTIGHGSSNNATTPVRVSHQDWLSERVVGISAGQWHSCVTLANGRSYTWGYNSKGQLASGGGRNDVPNLASGVAMNFIVRAECGHASTVFLTSKKLEHNNKKDKNQIRVFGYADSEEIENNLEITSISSSVVSAFIDRMFLIHFNCIESGDVYKISSLNESWGSPSETAKILNGNVVRNLIGSTPAVVCGGSNVIIIYNTSNPMTIY